MDAQSGLYLLPLTSVAPHVAVGVRFLVLEHLSRGRAEGLFECGDEEHRWCGLCVLWLLALAAAGTEPPFSPHVGAPGCVLKRAAPPAPTA